MKPENETPEIKLIYAILDFMKTNPSEERIKEVTNMLKKKDPIKYEYIKDLFTR